MAVVVDFHPSLDSSRFRLGLAWGSGLSPIAPSEGLPSFLQILVSSAAEEGFWPEGRKQAVRDMLRFGKYKPTGRGKPASEFLLGVALSGQFPAINGPVDVNNAVSLASGFPVSIFDAGKSGLAFVLRHGRAGESYVFNGAGHVIELEDLLCICRPDADGGEPCGNPVKDRMETKVGAQTRDVVAVLYAPRSEPLEDVEKAMAEFARLLREHCGAEEAGWATL